MKRTTRQLEPLGSEDPFLENQSGFYHTQTPSVEHKFNDTAVDETIPFNFDTEVRGVSIAMVFIVFLFGNVCGSMWTSLLFWLFL